MALSEIMTIVVFFQIFKSRTFKDYYLDHVTTWKHFFPKLVSYSRFVSLMKQVTVPLYVFQKILQGSSKGIAFIDSTPLSVCHICRSSSHKLFKDVAAKGKTSTGWFFGLKLHVIVNHKGEIITWSLTQGNVSDLSQVQPLCKNLKGKLVGDRGYISSKLFNLLIEEGLQLLTRIRSNMKNILMDTFDKCLLKKRALIESVFALFKRWSANLNSQVYLRVI
ncbi:Tnp-DDE-dom domain-containing protein [Rhabdochlamydiaceae symbiont of Dictyostelium giganteum]